MTERAWHTLTVDLELADDDVNDPNLLQRLAVGIGSVFAAPVLIDRVKIVRTEDA